MKPFTFPFFSFIFVSVEFFLTFSQSGALLICSLFSFSLELKKNFLCDLYTGQLHNILAEVSTDGDGNFQNSNILVILIKTQPFQGIYCANRVLSLWQP